jgi:hypothetical protein
MHRSRELGLGRSYAGSANRYEPLYHPRAAQTEELARLGNAKLLPGRPVDVFIKTLGRTAFSYLIKPLRDKAERAFKER